MIIIGMDANIGRNATKIRTESFEKLKDVLDLHEMRPDGPTFFPPGQTAVPSCLDLFLVSKKLTKAKVAVLVSYRGDHRGGVRPAHSLQGAVAE